MNRDVLREALCLVDVPGKSVNSEIIEKANQAAQDLRANQLRIFGSIQEAPYGEKMVAACSGFEQIMKDYEQFLDYILAQCGAKTKERNGMCI